MPTDTSSDMVNIEAVMEKLQRAQQQQRLKKGDDVMDADMRCNGDDYSDVVDQRRSFSNSPKEGNDSHDDDRNEMRTPEDIKDDEDLTDRSPEMNKSPALIAQQVALAAALAQRGNPQNGSTIPPSLSALFPHTVLQQFGHFQNNFDPSQLPAVCMTIY